MTDVHDNIERSPSSDPTVHRDLVVVDPPMEGRDVANLQRAIEDRLDARGIDIPTPTHGKFTHATAVAGVEAGYFTGLLPSTYLKVAVVDGDRRLVCTEGAQSIIRNPERRSPEQLERARSRIAQQLLGPKYYDELSTKVIGVRGGGSDVSLTYSHKWLGTTERPAGSNWGGKVTEWIQLAGYTSPVPWCGCFVNACVVAAGVPSGAGWIGYTPAIIVHARSRAGSWSWHGVDEGHPGDLALLDTPGGDPAVHVALVEKKLDPVTYQTVEGNTSSGLLGSQDNGGGVFRRERSTEGGFRIVGFARPPYHS